MSKLLRVSTQILAEQPKPWHFLILAIKSLTKDLIQANVCMQLRKTFQKLYNRKRCLPLEKRSLLTLPKHWKTWGMSMILACYTKKVLTREIKAIIPPALPRKPRKPDYSIFHDLTVNPDAKAAVLIRKIRMNITNLFMTKLSILLLPPLNIDFINQYLSCLLK